MKKNEKTKQEEVRQRLSIERWTVERLDPDAGMVRIESVPMRSEFLTQKFLAEVSKEDFEPGEDDLSFWDTGRAKIRRISINRFVKRSEPEQLKRKLSQKIWFFGLYITRARSGRSVYTTQRVPQETLQKCSTKGLPKRGEGEHDKQQYAPDSCYQCRAW
jgi:hypothetical protein